MIGIFYSQEERLVLPFSKGKDRGIAAVQGLVLIEILLTGEEFPVYTGDKGVEY